jgi:membrane protein
MSGQSGSERAVRTGLRDVLSFVWAVGSLVHDRRLTYLAAGVAYYAFVSLIPLLLLAVAVASFVGGAALVDYVTAVFNRQLSASGQAGVSRLLTDTTGHGAASVVGVATLAWTGSRLFRALDIAFDEMYADDVRTSLLEQTRNALVVVAGIGFAVALAVVAGLVASVLPLATPLDGPLGTAVLVAVLALALLPVYYVLPPTDVSIREVLPGALVAAVGWVLLQAGFGVYATNAGRYGAYGIIGAVLLFVTWLYFASIIVLVGGAVNAVHGNAAPTDP